MKHCSFSTKINIFLQEEDEESNDYDEMRGFLKLNRQSNPFSRPKLQHKATMKVRNRQIELAKTQNHCYSQFGLKTSFALNKKY